MKVKEMATHVVTPLAQAATKVDQLLIDILSWPRKHSTQPEIAFRAWLRAQLPADTVTLGEGTMFCRVATPKNTPATTMFSCHIDTVDCIEPANARKKLTFDPVMQMIQLDPANKVGTCLGADDGVGIWLMLKMIEAGVPGGYIFHTGEECGGIGARATLDKHKDVLSKYDIAIAFDRPRNDEVITHQGGVRCCSDKFATALCKSLGLDYKPSDRGVFTDTKVYRGVIAECTNIGVGYQDQHGTNEFLDYDHAQNLLAALLEIDYEFLPIDRDPKTPDPVAAPKYVAPKGGDLFGWDEWSRNKQVNVKSKPEPVAAPVPKGTHYDDLLGTSWEDLMLFCEDNPEEMSLAVVDLMEEIGRLRSDVKLYKSMWRTQ